MLPRDLCPSPAALSLHSTLAGLYLPVCQDTEWEGGGQWGAAWGAQRGHSQRHVPKSPGIEGEDTGLPETEATHRKSFGNCGGLLLNSCHIFTTLNEIWEITF